MLVFTARWIVPISSRPIANGAVVVDDGRIVDFGPAADVLEDAGDAPVRALGAVAIMPGLVNAHCHVELSWMRDDPPSATGYTNWVRELVQLRDDEDEERAQTAAQAAIEQMTQRGTVAVGDVANRSWTAPMLARSDLHAVVFHELLGFKSDEAEQTLAAGIARVAEMREHPDVAGAAGRVSIAISPHALHTNSAALLRGIATHAKSTHERISIHLAESSDELEMLTKGEGPFPAFLQERGAWEPDWTPPGLSPVEFLNRVGLLNSQTLVAHAVHLLAEDHAKLQTHDMTVVTCPRSNRNLGVGRAELHRLLVEGIPVALGTDSMASVPDLDLFAELQALCAEHSDVPPAAALRMATLNGAQALGLQGELGSIDTGKLARLVVVPVDSDAKEPFSAICSNPETIWHLEAAPFESD